MTPSPKEKKIRGWIHKMALEELPKIIRNSKRGDFLEANIYFAPMNPKAYSEIELTYQLPNKNK